MSRFNTIPPNPFPPSTDEDGTQAAQIKHLQEDVSTLQGNVSTLQGNVSTLQGNVSTLQGNVSTLSTTKANQATIAPYFSEETSYSIGDIVYYEGAAYRCTNAHEGAWDDDDFEVTTVALELDALKSGLITVENTLDTKVTYTSVAGTDANYRDVTIPSDNNAVFLIVAGGSITSVSTDSAGNISDIVFVSNSADSQKIDDHTVRIWGGSWYRSYSVLKLV